MPEPSFLPMKEPDPAWPNWLLGGNVLSPRSVPRFAWWILAAAVAVGAVCIVAALRSMAPRQLRFGAYTDTQIGFSLSAPPGWTLLRVPRTPHLREFLVLPPEAQSAEANTTTYARLTIRRAPGADPARRIVDDAQAAVAREAEEYQVLEQSEEKLSGRPSYSVTTTSASTLGTKWFRVTAVISGTLIAVWEQQVVPAAAARSLRRDMDRMLNEFRWR